MPINIYRLNGEDSESSAYFCENEWELSSQVYELEQWLIANASKVAPGSYVADIGFKLREFASGGGAVATVYTQVLLDWV